MLLRASTQSRLAGAKLPRCSGAPSCQRSLPRAPARVGLAWLGRQLESSTAAPPVPVSPAGSSPPRNALAAATMLLLQSHRTPPTALAGDPQGIPQHLHSKQTARTLRLRRTCGLARFIKIGRVHAARPSWGTRGVQEAYPKPHSAMTAECWSSRKWAGGRAVPFPVGSHRATTLH